MDQFVYMSGRAGAKGTDQGLSTAGARYSITPEITLGAINHYGWDTFNTFYMEENGAWDFSEGLKLRLSAHYTDHRYLNILKG